MLPTRSRRPIVYNRGMIAETGVIPAGLQLLIDNHSFRVMDVKRTVTESIIDGKKTAEPIMTVTGLFQEGDIRNANDRIYPRGILADAVRVIQEDMQRRAVYGELDHPCYTDVQNLKVLTVGDGWKPFADMKVGDLVWSRAGDGSMVQSTVTAITDEPYDGTAYKIRGKYIDSSLTPGHRLPLLNRIGRNKNGTNHNIQGQFYATIAEIATRRGYYSRKPIPRTARWTGRTDQKVSLPGVSGYKKRPWLSDPIEFDTLKFAGFVGLYLAEGYLKNSTGICISQTSEPGRTAMREFLNDLHPDLHWSEQKQGFYVNEPRLAAYLAPLGDKYAKYVPADIKDLDVPYLEELLHWFAIGGGRILSGSTGPRLSTCKYANSTIERRRLDTGEYGRMSISSVSERLIDDLHECLVKTGRCGRKSVVIPADDYVFTDHSIEAKNKVPLYQLHISRMRNVYLDRRSVAIEQFRHVGRIHCLTVTHGNFYVEHNGCSYWTGNSDAKIHLDRVSHLVTRAWMDGTRIYGEAEILDNQVHGRALRGLFERKCQVGISSRGIGDMEMREGQAEGKQYYEVLPGYQFVTWDAVAEPSVHGATLTVLENLNKKLKPIREDRQRSARKQARKASFLDQNAYENILIEEINKYFDIKDFGPRR